MAPALQGVVQIMDGAEGPPACIDSDADLRREGEMSGDENESR